MSQVKDAVHHHAHHFASADDEFEAAKQGMWIFLVTEVLFFGVLFATYALYRAWYAEAFAAASHDLLIWAGAIMGYLGGLHYWWPKISGRMYNESLAKLAAGIIFIGFNLTFFPQFILGYLGMPRRYHAYPPEFQVLNVLSSAGASILGVGYLIPMIYLMWSLRYGPIAGSNPFGASGLEWTTTSPPPTANFAETPTVSQEAYTYPIRIESDVA